MKSKKATPAKRRVSKVTPIPKLLEKTQKIFNAWIRNRDQDNRCICEGCNNPVEHASHYFSAGHYTALRFNEVNVNGSCMYCNRYLHGNLIQYRKGLIKKFGESKVLMLENSADVRKTHKWDRYELEALIETYKLKK